MAANLLVTRPRRAAVPLHARLEGAVKRPVARVGLGDGELGGLRLAPPGKGEPLRLAFIVPAAQEGIGAPELVCLLPVIRLAETHHQ